MSQIGVPVTTFAKGGGCFLAGTEIETPTGVRNIEDLQAGDEVISYNEQTKSQETSKIGKIDVLERDEYFIINGIVKATAEHPFYTTQGQVKVKDLKVGLKLVGRYDKEIEIYQIERVPVMPKVKVYNLLNVLPNNNYYAQRFLVHNKGGGCFPAGTKVTTPDGKVAIEKLKVGDFVTSYNEVTQRKQKAKIGAIDVLQQDHLYTINGHLSVTAEHPFYTMRGMVQAQELKLQDELFNEDGSIQVVSKLEYTAGDVKVYNLINVEPNHNYFANGIRVHNKGGFSGGGRSSVGGGRSLSSGKSSSSSSKSSTPSKPAYGKSSAKAGSTIKTSDGKTVKASTKAPTNKKYTSQKGVVGDNGYQPRFTNGYTPAPGSVVYYNQTSFVDYLPWIYLFGHSNATPQNTTATVVAPDGKETVAKPEPGGTDGLAVLNWIIMIIIVLAIIGGIVWLVNKLTNKDNTPKRPSYGW